MRDRTNAFEGWPYDDVPPPADRTLPPPPPPPPSVAAPVVPDVVGEPSRAAQAPWCLGVAPVDQPVGLALPPDTVLDGGSVAHRDAGITCEVRLVSARGASHRCYAEPRQDHAGVHVVDGWILAAVADGAGSEPLSHVGARLAVEVVLERLALAVQDREDDDLPRSPARLLPTELVDGLLRDVATVMCERARRELASRVEPRRLSTTLCVAAVSPPDPKGRLISSVWRIGDSTAYVLDDDRLVPVFGERGTGELVSSATDALPMSTTPERKDGTITADNPLFLVTDGLAMPLGDGSGEVGRYLAERWQEPPDPLTFLVQSQFHRKSFDDDRSVVGIWAR